MSALSDDEDEECAHHHQSPGDTALKHSLVPASGRRWVGIECRGKGNERASGLACSGPCVSHLCAFAQRLALPLSPQCCLPGTSAWRGRIELCAKSAIPIRGGPSSNGLDDDIPSSPIAEWPAQGDAQSRNQFLLRPISRLWSFRFQRSSIAMISSGVADDPATSKIDT